MAAIITEKFRTHNAKQFIEDFSESGQSNYIFIGRSHAWTDDTSPPAPANSQSEEIGAYEDMIALKKLRFLPFTNPAASTLPTKLISAPVLALPIGVMLVLSRYFLGK